ncbi:hypothetical protein [Streptomyces sp. CL7]|uniref:hypothetical protein n=1 Tax=Streptomyces sp. CL7 TaxID=3096006 RepID=UPI002A75DEA5|nr:hypothetical protein [Streptomyces sp. CL7]WPP31030.1 hypothetical protein SJH97_17655 [Streptomyces sp. CL7]
MVQVPGHHTDRGALAHQLLGGGPVRLPAAPARPAAEHGVPQQRVGVPVQSVREVAIAEIEFFGRSNTTP